jgi:hypothetical protein
MKYEKKVAEKKEKKIAEKKKEAPVWRTHSLSLR